MTTIQLQSKRLLIIGLSLTGLSVVRYLKAHNVTFDVLDEKATLSEADHALLGEATVYRTLSAELCCSYDVLVISPGVPRALAAITAAIANKVQVVGDIELFAAVADKPIIAVTGSNGKSTVVSWAACVLNYAGYRVALCGNIGTPALDCLHNPPDVYILELSSYQLESTVSLAATSAVVLNISDDHMDRYDSLAHYAATKRSIYHQCAHPVINRDDHLSWPQLSDRGSGSDKPTLSLDNAIYYSAQQGKSASVPMAEQSLSNNQDRDRFASLQPHDKQVQLQADGTVCLFDGEQAIVDVKQLPLPGQHNVANALAVLALLSPFKLSPDQLKQGLVSFHGLPHRTEFIRERRGVRWYNDSKGTNVDACHKAIEAMSGPVVLIAGGLGKGADFSELCEVVQRQVKALVLMGRDAPLIEQALRGVTSIYQVDSLKAAVALSDQLSDSGDVVLLSPACASFDMFRSFEERGERFRVAVEGMAA